MALTTAQDSTVELVLAGHVHFYDRDVITGEKDVLQLVGGAGFRGEAILLHITGENRRGDLFEDHKNKQAESPGYQQGEPAF